METTTVDRVPREYVAGRRSCMRVTVPRSDDLHGAAGDLDGFVERLRVDVFEIYAAVRDVQREGRLPVSRRLRSLGSVSERAARLSRTIEAYASTPFARGRARLRRADLRELALAG